MTHKALTNPETITVQLSPEMVTVATKRAKAMGMDVSEYVAHILQDELNDPWRMPVPPEVDARWEREIAETEEYEKIHPRPAAKTADELIKLLDEEAAKLPDNEGN